MPVLKNLHFTGWEFIRDVLRELGYDRWSEANQRSPKNDAYTLRVVRELVKSRE